MCCSTASLTATRSLISESRTSSGNRSRREFLVSCRWIAGRPIRERTIPASLGSTCISSQNLLTCIRSSPTPIAEDVYKRQAQYRHGSAHGRRSVPGWNDSSRRSRGQGADSSLNRVRLNGLLDGLRPSSNSSAHPGRCLRRFPARGWPASRCRCGRYHRLRVRKIS